MFLIFCFDSIVSIEEQILQGKREKIIDAVEKYRFVTFSELPTNFQQVGGT
jgi:hypothetical protein